MAIKRVTANLPADLVREATQLTGRGITETLVWGLQLIRRRRAYQKFLALKGTIDLRLDVDALRGRPRR